LLGAAAGRTAERLSKRAVALCFLSRPISAEFAVFQPGMAPVGSITTECDIADAISRFDFHLPFTMLAFAIPARINVLVVLPCAGPAPSCATLIPQQNPTIRQIKATFRFKRHIAFPSRKKLGCPVMCVEYSGRGRRSKELKLKWK
jgi:hypothetical protein